MERKPSDMSAAYPTPMETIDVGAESRKLSAKLSAFVREDSLTPFQAALKADAERLAELCRQRDGITASLRKSGKRYERGHLDIIIVVYEECAARGRTFGGGS